MTSQPPTPPVPSDSESQGIHLFHKDLDELFGPHGVPTGTLTELAGAPGSGRTQLTAHLAAHASLPAVLGGLSGDTLYIDTRGALVPDYCYSAFAALRERLASERTNALDISDESISAIDEYLDSHASPAAAARAAIHHYRVTSYVSLLATMTALESLVHAHPKTRLIVINGFPMESYPESDLLRGAVDRSLTSESDEFVRTAAARNLLHGALSIAKQRRCAVILCTNLQSRDDVFVPFDAPWTRLVRHRYLMRAVGGCVHSAQRIDPVVGPEWRDGDGGVDAVERRYLESVLEAHGSVQFDMKPEGLGYVEAE